MSIIFKFLSSNRSSTHEVETNLSVEAYPLDSNDVSELDSSEEHPTNNRDDKASKNIV